MAISREENLKQLRKVRSISKGTDIGDKIQSINKKYYPQSKNVLDYHIDTWEEHSKTQQKRLDKINKHIKTFENFKTDQLEIGTEIEKEHYDVYTYLKDYLEKNNLKMPLSLEEFATKIAKAHLRELKDYYTRLIDMEKAAEIENNLKNL